MGRQKRKLPAKVYAVRERIEEWRRTREKRTRMPEDLWEDAASAARAHGTWAVSRALRVNYESLKKRCAGEKGVEAPSIEERASGFVELAASALLDGAEERGHVVEIVGTDGAKLRILMPRRSPFNVYTVIAAFWDRLR